MDGEDVALVALALVIFAAGLVVEGKGRHIGEVATLEDDVRFFGGEEAAVAGEVFEVDVGFYLSVGKNADVDGAVEKNGIWRGAGETGGGAGPNKWGESRWCAAEGGLFGALVVGGLRVEAGDLVWEITDGCFGDSVIFGENINGNSGLEQLGNFSLQLFGMMRAGHDLALA